MSIDGGAPRRSSPPNDPLAWLLIPLTVVAVTLLLVFFVFFHYTTVDGDSMRPNLLTEDRLLLTKGYGTPHRGDVVVFTMKERGKEVEVVKRVIGLPGDEVSTNGDRAWVNGEPEPAAFGPLIGQSERVTGPTLVPEGTIFVMGDNRPVSLDSRFIGPVPLRSVLGRAVVVYAPVTRLRMLDPAR